MGLGVVIGTVGDVLASMCAVRRGGSSPYMAKGYVLWRAMVLCLELGFEEVIFFEGDAKELIDVVKSKEEEES